MLRPWKRRSELEVRVPIVTHRASRHERGYDNDWYRVAEARREADCGLCQPCLKIDRVTASNEVDHIVPLHVRPEWRLEFDNTQVICRPCHRRKTQQDSQRYGSSTSRVIAQDQRSAREEALRMVLPPRSANAVDRGEVVSASLLR